jgi:lipoyl(octanoyl) transferase
LSPTVNTPGLSTLRLIFDAAAPGAWNMALDESLLIDAADSGIGTLRFYAWNEPTLSLGYFQQYEQRLQHAASVTCACVRRQTGGGAILHDRELTYSLVLPPGHPGTRQSESLYIKVHDAFISALSEPLSDRSTGVVLRRVDKVSNTSKRQPFLCFQRRAVGDVVAIPLTPPLRTDDPSHPAAADWKILGSAQRRSRGALLQHGSLLFARSAAAPELPGYLDVTGTMASPPDLMLYVSRLRDVLEVEFVMSEIPQNVELIARELTNTKYGAATWTKRR